ncbi:MAG TPA: endo-1,4-beta-xylanase [Cellvibrio sp.]|nr:endo-1,4-beta-xylanase [Cellvibrio sp.]
MPLKLLPLACAAGTLIFASHSQAQTTNPGNCGYSVSSGLYATWPNPSSYQGWSAVVNKTGEVATSFKILLDLGNTSIRNGYQADYSPTESGYFVNSPSWLKNQKIAQGKEYRFGYIGTGTYSGATGYVISINGQNCDTEIPLINLSANKKLFTSNANITLSAQATDNVAVRKVVFEQDGKVIGQVTKAPFTLTLPVTSSDNGRHIYTATAYDPSGNKTSSKPVRVFTAIGNRFLGSAVDNLAEFADLPTYFNQLTPGNAGKWGSVEATRNVMKWDSLDYAYNFAKANGMPFKMHTLIWGQQAPAWMNNLTAEEQLAEINEWMAAAAQRYPDVEMIDVVNEPLHAPPAFRNALGGAGVTGWDWMIKSFEMARTHFPHAQLILNDYQIIIMESFTQDYLKLITLLQERDLIDGIGLQSHFLERAENDVVKKNLETLAATGLPIYISEFDLNFKNDAQHANRMRDLFTIFWDNPSVVGVTHWGHLQGNMWRENAYLIRTNKTLRPGFEWMLCYAVGGTNCAVPDYIPAGWTGDATGLTLQAEEYDEGKGIIASGDVVSYTDAGDWIAFKKVNFQTAWDQLSITYIKGNTDLGSVSFHLDSLDAAPLAEKNLESTGGWNTPKSVTIPWPAVSGQHDVYIKFNNVYGVANIDSVKFHAPDGGVGFGPNLISNGNFESGNTSGWFSWGGTITADTLNPHNGSYALKLGNRSGNGPAAYSLKSLVKPGGKYAVKLWASIAGAASANVNITSKIGCAGTDSYSWLVSPVTINNGQWVELSGQLNVPQCDLTDLLIYAEGPAGGIDIYLDDVSAREIVTANLVSNGDFELGNVNGWSSWAGTVSATTEIAQSGSYSLKLSGRSGNGPAVYNNVKPLLTAGKTYSVSMGVTIRGAATAPVNITRKLTCGSATTYSWVANTPAVAENTWSTLKGDLTIPADCVINDFIIYAEGPAGGIDLFVDDVVITAK